MRSSAICLSLVVTACLGDSESKGRVDALPDPDGLEISQDSRQDATPDETRVDVPVETSEDVPIEVSDDVPPEIIDVPPEVVDVPIEITDDVPVETADDVPVEIADDVPVEIADDIAVDIAVEIAVEIEEEVVASTCGDDKVEGKESCDDDLCDDDGCTGCAFDPALAVVELELDDTVGYDIDNADGDGDDTTGIDNALGASALVRGVLSTYVGTRVASGDILILAILGAVDTLAGDDDARLTLVSGDDALCPPVSPPLWLTRDDTPATVARDASGYVGCEAPLTLDDNDDPDNGILPNPARLRYHAATVVLDLGPLDAFTLVRARVEGQLAISGGALRGLDDGVIAGIVPAKTLKTIDTNSLTNGLCPTAFHAVLGLVGHMDQDADGGGGRDFIQWTTSAGIPCVTAPVTVVACCDEGDCVNGKITGADCVNDARIGDGWSAAFRTRANAVNVIGPAGTCP